MVQHMFRHAHYLSTSHQISHAPHMILIVVASQEQ